MTPRCIIIGWYGYNNIGDELMLHSLLSHIRNDLDIVVVSADPQQTERIHNVKSIPIGWSTLKYLKEADKIFFGGGQIFSDKRLRTIPLWSSLMHTIRLLNKNCQIALLNQGVEATNKITRLLLSSAASCSDFISIRDSSSLQLIKSLKLDVPISYGPDILFSLDLYNEPKINVKKGKSHGGTIGINVRPPFWWCDQIKSNKLINSLASSLDMIINETDLKPVLIPFRLPNKELHDDLEFSKKIITSMMNKDQISIVNYPLDETFLENFINAFNQFEFIIGTALHSLILSYKLGIPFLALPYQSKCEIFMNDIGLPHSLLNLNEICSSHLLLKKIFRLLDSKYDIRAQLLYKEKQLFFDSKKAHIEPLFD